MDYGAYPQAATAHLQPPAGTAWAQAISYHNQAGTSWMPCPGQPQLPQLPRPPVFYNPYAPMYTHALPPGTFIPSGAVGVPPTWVSAPPAVLQQQQLHHAHLAQQQQHQHQHQLQQQANGAAVQHDEGFGEDFFDILDRVEADSNYRLDVQLQPPLPPPPPQQQQQWQHSAGPSNPYQRLYGRLKVRLEDDRLVGTHQEQQLPSNNRAGLAHQQQRQHIPGLQLSSTHQHKGPNGNSKPLASRQPAIPAAGGSFLALLGEGSGDSSSNANRAVVQAAAAPRPGAAGLHSNKAGAGNSDSKELAGNSSSNQHVRAANPSGFAARNSPEQYFRRHVLLTDPFWATATFDEVGLVAVTHMPPAQGAAAAGGTLTCQLSMKMTTSQLSMVKAKTACLVLTCLLVDDPVPYRCHWPPSARLMVNGNIIYPCTAKRSGADKQLTPHQVDASADISEHVSGHPTIMVQVTATPSNSSNSFVLGARLVRRQGMEHVKSLMQAMPSLAAAVAAVRRKLSSDDDIEVSATTVSLRCALTNLRMKTPAQYASATSLICFDLDSYLQMTQRTGKWQCPVSMALSDVGNLVHEPYMAAVLESLGNAGLLDTVQEIEVAPDGRWRPKVASGASSTDSSWFSVLQPPNASQLGAAVAAQGLKRSNTADDQPRSRKQRIQQGEGAAGSWQAALAAGSGSDIGVVDLTCDSDEEPDHQQQQTAAAAAGTGRQQTEDPASADAGAGPGRIAAVVQATIGKSTAQHNTAADAAGAASWQAQAPGGPAATAADDGTARAAAGSRLRIRLRRPADTPSRPGSSSPTCSQAESILFDLSWSPPSDFSLLSDITRPPGDDVPSLWLDSIGTLRGTVPATAAAAGRSTAEGGWDTDAAVAPAAAITVKGRPPTVRNPAGLPVLPRLGPSVLPRLNIRSAVAAAAAAGAAAAGRTINTKQQQQPAGNLRACCPAANTDVAGSTTAQVSTGVQPVAEVIELLESESD